MRPLELVSRIHHFGTNILGLLLFGIQIGMFFVTIPCLENGYRVLGLFVLFVSLLVPGSIDIYWRSRAEPRHSLWRYLLPGSGGSLLFVPTWCWFVGQPVFGLGILVYAAILKN